MNPAVPLTVRNQVLDVIASEFGVERGLPLTRRGPDPWGMLARHIAYYVLSVEAGFGPEATSRAFGLDHKQISYAARRIEDRRDTPVFELAMERVLGRLRRTRVLALLPSGGQRCVSAFPTAAPAMRSR